MALFPDVKDIFFIEQDQPNFKVILLEPLLKIERFFMSFWKKQPDDL